jgi:hypothetical protein
VSAGLSRVYLAVDPGQRGGMAAVLAGPGIKPRAAVRWADGKHGYWRGADPRRLEIVGAAAGCIDEVLTGAALPEGVAPADVPVTVALEALLAFEGEGVKSTKTSAIGWAVLREALRDMARPLGSDPAVLRPQTWRRMVGLPRGAGKSVTIAWCARVWPSVGMVPPGGRVASDGAADALAMASALAGVRNAPEEVRG